MAERISKTDVEKMLRAIAEAGAVNLDVSVRKIMDSVSPVLREIPNGGELSLHILCCDEYFLVTE